MNLAASYCALARAVGADGRPEEAASWWQKAEEQLSAFLGGNGSDVRAREYLWLANTEHAPILRDMGRYEEALADYEASLNFRVANRVFLQEGAWLMANVPDASRRNPERAIELAKLGVTSYPTDSVLWRTLGGAYYRAGKWSEALEALNKAVEVHSKGGGFNSWVLLAMVHHQLGDRQQAQGWYEKAAANFAGVKEPNEEMRRPAGRGDAVAGPCPALPSAASPAAGVPPLGGRK